jgi:hypothetical protein
MELLNFSTNQIQAFKTSFEVIDSLVSDTNLEITPIGIRIREINRTSKLFLSVFFSADNFDIWNYTSGADVFNVGIDITNIVNALKPNLHYDVLTFSLSSSQGKLVLESFERNEKKCVTFELIVPCPNTSGVIEHKVYSHSVELSSELITKYAKDINRTSNLIKIKLSRKVLCVGSADGNLEYQLSGGGISITTDDLINSVECTMNVKYFLLSCKCSNISELITIYIGDVYEDDHFPTVKFNLGSLGTLSLSLF